MTTTITEIRALLERVEGATGPDRELDGDIAEAFNMQPEKCRKVTNGIFLSGPTNNEYTRWIAPNLTASIDAAVAFFEAVLPGWFHTSGTCALSGHCSVGPDYNGPERERLLRKYPPGVPGFSGWVFDVDLETGTHRQQRAIIAATLRAMIAESEVNNAE